MNLSFGPYRPRVNLLIADDVGLGKTIEVGLVAQELILRHRVQTALVICPAPLQQKWQMELSEKFGLHFESYLAVGVELGPTTFGRTWNASPNEALALSLQQGTVQLRSETDAVVDVSVSGLVRVARADIGLEHFDLTVELEGSAGPVLIILDHGTLEAFLPDGRTISMLTFAGANWSVAVSGDSRWSVLR